MSCKKEVHVREKEIYQNPMLKKMQKLNGEHDKYFLAVWRTV